MPGVDGSWDCRVKTPLGDQDMTLAITTSGTTFTGTASGRMGSDTIAGEVDGDTLRWKHSVTVPMTMTLDCQATVSGDALTGEVGAGVLGTFPMTGVRKG